MLLVKEFEKLTFSDPQVQQQFQNILLLQVNMTKNSPENKALMERFNVMGLPTILFLISKIMKLKEVE